MNVSLTLANRTGLKNASFSGMSKFVVSTEIRDQIHIGTVVLGCLSFFGALASFILLIVAWPKPSRRSGFTALMYNFIVLHFVMNFINMPSYNFLPEAMMDNRWIPVNICYYIRLFYSAVEFTINWCDAEMAVNRIIALFFPFHYAKWTSKPVIIGMIVFDWVVGGGGNFITFVQAEISSVITITPLGVCGWNTAAAGDLGQSLYVVLVLVPYAMSGLGAILIFIKSTMLAYRSRTVSVGGGGAPSAAPSRNLQHRLKMSRMLLLTYVYAALCVTPGNVLVYAYPVQAARDPMALWWMRAPRTLQFSGTPCILLIYNDEYRNRLKEIIMQRIRSSSSAGGISGTSMPDTAATGRS